MADQGWVHNGRLRRWELRGPDGVRSSGYITDEVLRRADQAYLTRVIARNGWPPAYAEKPWLDAMLAGGPFDGRHWYHDPGGLDGPPGHISLYTGELTVIPVAALIGGDLPGGDAPLPPPPALHVYRRGRQACGHGLWCPVPYVWAAS